MTPLMIASAVAAAPAARPDAAGPAKSGTPLTAVVVGGGPAPKVINSFPADGGQAPGGVLVMKIVFDQTMAPDSWSFAPVDGHDFPDCLDRPRLLADHRTSVLLCTVKAHRDYAVKINQVPLFVGADGRVAQPVTLHFNTADVAVRSLHDALAQADLNDADEPIMRWQDSGAGISQSQAPRP